MLDAECCIKRYASSHKPRASIGGQGVSPTGTLFRFVSFVRSCVRAVWLLSGIRAQKADPPFPLLPFAPPSFPFAFCESCIKHYTLYKVYREHKVYEVYKVYKKYKVYKMCKVFLPYPTPKPPIQL